MLIATPMLGLPRVSVAGSSQQLSVGSWWTLKDNYRRALTESGKYEGTITETYDYAQELLVTKMDTGKITLSQRGRVMVMHRNWKLVLQSE